jgi:PKHD-type hydroxylase
MNYSSHWSFYNDPVHEWAFWDMLFTEDECQSIILLGEKNNLINGTIRENEHVSDIRKSKISWVSPSDETRWIYQRLTDAIVSLNNQFFGFDLSGFNEGLQFTKYEAPDSKYDLHVDVVSKGIIRKLSIVLQLQKPELYDGGELQLVYSSEPTILGKNQGTLLVFPSYVLHRVTPVSKGTRYSLVGWVSGKPFK